MKRKTTEDQRKELHYGRKRHQRELLRKSRFYQLDKPSPPIQSLFKGEIISAPEVISIYEFSSEETNFYTETVRFSERLEKLMAKGPCVVDFRQTRRVSAAALVIVCAALDSCERDGKWISTVLWSEVSPSVNQALKRTRIADKIKGKNFDYNFSSIKNLPVISSSGNEHMEDILDYIQKCVYENKMEPETEHIYGDAVSETINNVGLHAYPDALASSKRWWLLCDVVGDQLYLAIYDRGVGIPKTVLDKPWFLDSMEKVYPDQYGEMKREFPELERSGMRIFVPRKLYDTQMIYLSMQGDVSGTRKDKHGQGSKSIKALVNETDDGKLWIFSNKGLYKFYRDEVAPELYRLPKKMPGTLVQWNIKLS